jgi:SecD/SecF fusion protein
MLATAGVKGFAFTLGIGTLVSLFTAVLATSAILGTMARSRLLARKSALGAGRQTGGWHFDFMGRSRWFFSMSGAIIAAGAIAIATLGINFGIDFKSGTRITTPLERPASVQQVRNVLSPLGYGDAKIQQVNDPALGRNIIQISTRTLQPAKVQKVESALDSKFGIRVGSVSVNSIGPTFGAQIARTAIIAIIASLILISLYIGLRFQFKFAVPVLIALAHDVLITSGVYALTGREVTTATVAALLTIIGYSLYDTVIVFDRIRENLPRMPRATFSQIANRSMAEVLTRSLATSFSALLPIASLLLFGGETLRDFAFALLVGVASGAYSSIFIATPVLTEWKEREPVFMRRRRIVMEEHRGLVPAFAAATFGGEEVAEAPARPARERRVGRAGRRAARLARPPAPAPETPPAPEPRAAPEPEPAPEPEAAPEPRAAPEPEAAPEPRAATAEREPAPAPTDGPPRGRAPSDGAEEAPAGPRPEGDGDGARGEPRRPSPVTSTAGAGKAKQQRRRRNRARKRHGRR